MKESYFDNLMYIYRLLKSFSLTRKVKSKRFTVITVFFFTNRFEKRKIRNSFSSSILAFLSITRDFLGLGFDWCSSLQIFS